MNENARRAGRLASSAAAVPALGAVLPTRVFKDLQPTRGRATRAPALRVPGTTRCLCQLLAGTSAVALQLKMEVGVVLGRASGDRPGSSVMGGAGGSGVEGHPPGADTPRQASLPLMVPSPSSS